MRNISVLEKMDLTSNTKKINILKKIFKEILKTTPFCYNKNLRENIKDIKIIPINILIQKKPNKKFNPIKSPKATDLNSLRWLRKIVNL